MSVKKIENIEEFILDDNLEKYTRKEREIIINELFKDEYQGKEISCILNGEEVLAVVNAYTRKNYIARGHSGYYESNKEYRTRQDIAYSGDYLNLLNSTEYQYSTQEHKPDQTGVHEIGNLWHYFKKCIKCNDKYYSVNIDILEKNGRFTVYNTKLKEVDAQTLNPSIIPTSSKASITENGDKYQTINNDNRVYNINLNFDSLNDNKKKDR